MNSTAWVWAFVLAVGCTKPNPRSCADGVCDDPRFPFCDVNGDIAGSPDTCIEGQCEPNQIAGCQDDDVVTCNANGTNFETASCDFGCQGDGATASCNLCEPNTATCDGDNIKHCGADGRVESVETCSGTCAADPVARCTNIAARYLPNVCDELAAEPVLHISNSATFDTNLDSNCNGGILSQPGAAALCVVRYGAIQLEAGVELTVVGARALALVADSEATIAGYLDLSAGPGTNGPGGGSTYSGGRATELCGGLGGAGFATRGANGGSSTANGGSNNGGPVAADPGILSVLIGGPQSGEPSDMVYGGGGGAATIVACRGAVNVSGEVNAGGGGGISFFAGFGGGAGGYVVFQGMRVNLTGKLFANGGGGGAGSFGGESNAGTEGKRDLTNDNFGFSTNGGANGGRGGVGALPPNVGLKMPAGTGCGAGGGGGGGGGGSIGFFQTYTPVGVDPIVTPSMASPIPRPNANVATH
jgi:hypothetical protein